MVKILKNTTASPISISDTGVTIPASPGTYSIPTQDYALWAASTQIITNINSGAIVVNDGVVDLIKPNARDFIAGLENEAGLMLARQLNEHTGMIYDADQCPCQRTTISFDNATRTLTHVAKSPYTTIDFLLNDVLYQLSGTQSKQITDTEGEWYFYYDSSLVLQASQSPFIFKGQVFVATVYWDSTNKRAISIGDERHGAIMDLMTHYTTHRTEGMKIESTSGALTIGNYIESGDGSLNSHATYSISDGDLFDEDLPHRVRNSASPSNPFEQVLSPVARVPVYYLTGANSWRRKDPTDYAFIEDQPNPARYNLFSAGTWSLANCTNGYFFATWLIFTNDINYPVATILGQRQDADLISAINNNTRASLSLPNFFSQERYLYRKLIWQTNTNYSNTPKVRLRFVSTVSEIAPTNDRYAIICSYNGNAGSGRYLEFYPGQGSDTSPFPVPEVSYIRTVTLSSTASSTGTVSFYKSTDLNNAIFSVSLSSSVYSKTSLTYVLNADDKLVAKLSSGSINKPAITVFIQTSL